MGYTERTTVADLSAKPVPEDDDAAALKSLARARERIVAQIHETIVGQQSVIDLLLTCLFAGGHGLFVGVPGLAKTLLVSSLAQALDLEFSRIQFTPDLMPADITGSEVLEEDPGSRKRSFRFVAGPVFCNLLLADEINRTPPKTQAALLQAMQEQRVTAGGRTHTLPPPFHVFATQNPIEQEGTYPLPEAQLDRFTLQILIDYPDEESERRIVARGTPTMHDVTPTLTPAELLAHQELVRRIPVPQSVVEHAVALLRASRPADEGCPAQLRELLRWGAGPRAGQQLVTASQARVALNGRAAVTIEDVRALAGPVLEHRLVRSFAAESRGIGTAEIMERLLQAVPV
ncbi:MAG: AAA family ATPase [Planctomycetota bacterium]|jgi:MoxR-like ATPase